MKMNWKLLIICIAIPLAVGTASALLTGGGMQTQTVSLKVTKR